MKKIIFLLSAVCMMSSCRNQDKVSPRNASGEEIVEEQGVNVDFTEELEGVETIPLAIQGSWEVVEYSKEKIDQTNFFEGFVFTFNPDGSVLATKGDILVLGTYEVVPTGGSNNLVVTFPATTPFPSLNYTWTNINASDGTLEFEMNNKDLVLERS